MDTLLDRRVYMKKRKGFTLIELIAVLVILALTINRNANCIKHYKTCKNSC